MKITDKKQYITPDCQAISIQHRCPLMFSEEKLKLGSRNMGTPENTEDDETLENFDIGW